MMQKLLNLVQTVLSWLPTSPFVSVPSTISNSQGVRWFCWFFPVHDCLTLAAAWLAAIVLFYLASILLRWVKAIS